MPGVRPYEHGVTITLPRATAIYGHALHPLYTARKSRSRPVEEGQDPESRPPVTVVPAYREAAVIGTRLDELVLDGLIRNGRPDPLEINIVADEPATADSHRTWLSAGFGIFSSGSDPPGDQNPNGRSSPASSPPPAKLAVNRTL